MSKTNGSSRNQRNDPYQLEQAVRKFNRTPAGNRLAGGAPNSSPSRPSPPRCVADTWAPSPGPVALGGFLAVVLAVPHSRRFITAVLVRAGPAPAQRLCLRSTGATPAPAGSRWSCDPGPPRWGADLGAGAARASAAEDFEAHSASSPAC